MSTRTFFRALALSLLALLLLNLAMVPWARHLPYRRKMKEIHDAQQPNILFVGDSLLDVGRVDAAALNRGAQTPDKPLRPVVAAFVSTLPPDQALLAEYAIDAHPQVRTMVIGVMDFLLTRDDRFTPMNMTGNHEIGLNAFYSISMVSQLNQWNALDRFEFRLLRWFPMATHRMNLWQYIEVLRRYLAQQGMPHETANSFGRRADMFNLEASSPQVFDQEAQHFLNPSGHFNLSYQDIFASARTHNIRVVLVVMPMPTRHLETFYARPSWHAYLNKVDSLAGQRGFRVIDASDWFDDPDDFADNMHLSSAGGKAFSERLGAQLSNTKTEPDAP